MIETIDAISGLLMEAAGDPNAWPMALNAIDNFVDASGIILLCTDERLNNSPHSDNMSELVTDYFENGWYTQDQRDICIPLLKRQHVVFDHDFIDTERTEYLYGDYYSSFLSKHRVKYFAGLSINLEDDLWCLAMQRSSGKGPFDRSSMARFEAVWMRLANAAMHSRIVAREWYRGYMEALDNEAVAAILTDLDGRIIYINKGATALADGFRPSFVRIKESTAARITDLIRHSKLFPVSGSVASANETRFEFEGRIFRAKAIRLKRTNKFPFSRSTILVRIYPEAPETADLLRNLYGLTKGEIRVAIGLAEGLDVSLMAQNFAVTPNNIRAHLKAAYSKTGAKNQIQLASLITRAKNPDL